MYNDWMHLSDLDRFSDDDRVAVFVLDEDDKLVYVNARFIRGARMSREDIIGRTALELFGKDPARRWSEHNRATREASTFTVFEDTWYDYEDEILRRYLAARILVTLDDKPHIVGLTVEVTGSRLGEFERALADVRGVVVTLIDLLGDE